MPKDFKSVRREAVRQGWTVDETRNGHWKFTPPDRTKPIVYAAGTPLDHRALDNLISQLRRSGLIWPPPRR
jgi:hypothetical protein